MLIGQLPSRPIEKGIAGPGLLAQILIDKNMDHLPLYRRWKRFLRMDVDIPVTTMGGCVQACAELLRPQYELQKEQVVASSYIMAD
jgi:transposase